MTLLKKSTNLLCAYSFLESRGVTVTDLADQNLQVHDSFPIEESVPQRQKSNCSQQLSFQLFRHLWLVEYISYQKCIMNSQVKLMVYERYLKKAVRAKMAA